MPLAAALTIGKFALPFLGKLFGGGAPTYDDLTKNTKDTSQMLTGALRQSQDLRGDQIAKSRELQDIDINNARSVGAFDPAAFGASAQADPDNPWAHLSSIGDTFAGADFGAKALGRGFDREQGILQLVNQIAQQAPSMNLGIDNLLMQAGAKSGAGMGTAVGAAGTGLLNFLGDKFGGGDSGGGGGPMLGQPSFQDSGPVAEFGPMSAPSAAPPMPSSFGVGPAGAGGGGFLPPGSSGQGFDASALIQSIINGAR